MFPDREFDEEMKILMGDIPLMGKSLLEKAITLAIYYIRNQQVAPRKAGKMERIHTTTVALDRMWRKYNEG